MGKLISCIYLYLIIEYVIYFVMNVDLFYVIIKTKKISSDKKI